MIQIINRLKKNKIFSVIGVIVNIIIAVYIAQYIVGHYLIAHGQNYTNQTVDNQTGLPQGCDPNAPSIPEYCLNNSNSVIIYRPNDTTWNQQQKELFQSLINYCYEHADRHNPIQDLVDKGFLPSGFKGQTCISVREMHDTLESKINEDLAIEFNKKLRINIMKEKAKQDALSREQDKASPYASCLLNTDTTFEECFRMFGGMK